MPAFECRLRGISKPRVAHHAGFLSFGLLIFSDAKQLRGDQEVDTEFIVDEADCGPGSEDQAGAVAIGLPCTDRCTGDRHCYLAQLVEQRNLTSCVVGSNPAIAINIRL